MDRSFSERMKAGLLGAKVDWQLRPANPTTEKVRSLPIDVLGADLAPTLGKGERGTVIFDAPKSWFPAPGMASVSWPYQDDVALRTALLFFDRIDIPDSRVMDFNVEARAAIKSLGVGQSSIIQIGGDMAAALSRAAFEAFRLLDAREPGRWSISRTPEAVEIPTDELEPARGVGIELVEALPIFSREVPLDEVLAYKQKRFDELLALRHHMDDLCLTVTQNGAAGLAKTSALERFDKALADHIKAMGESNLSKVTASLRQNLGWSDVAATVGTPAVQMLLTNSHSAAGMLAGAFSLAIKTGRALRGQKSTTPFEYLTSVNRELW